MNFPIKNAALRFLLLGLIASVLMFTTACDDDNKDDPTITFDDVMEAIEDNQDADRYSSFLAAVDRAGLRDDFETSATITLFVPNNDAFAKFLSDNNFSSLNDVPVDLLSRVLQYHALTGTEDASDLDPGFYTTMNQNSPDGDNLSLYADNTNGVMLNSSVMVVKGDIGALNGVAHEIGSVLTPPTVVELAMASPELSILVDAVVHAELADELSATGPFTVFAPKNGAFRDLLASLSLANVEEIDKEELANILLYHVVPGNNRESDIDDGQYGTLLEGSTLQIEEDGDLLGDEEMEINGDVNVTDVDIQGTNGVVHLIEAVLQP